MTTHLGAGLEAHLEEGLLGERPCTPCQGTGGGRGSTQKERRDKCFSHRDVGVHPEPVELKGAVESQ